MADWDEYIDIPVPKTRWTKKVAYKFKNNRMTREKHLLKERRETRGHKQNRKLFDELKGKRAAREANPFRPRRNEKPGSLLNSQEFYGAKKNRRFVSLGGAQYRARG